MSFSDCIREAFKAREIDATERDALLKRYAEHLRNAQSEGSAGAGSRAQQRFAKELDFAAVEKKRQMALQANATAEIASDLRSFRTAVGKKADVVAGAYNIMENHGGAGYGSVRGRLQALLAATHAQMSDFVWNFRRNNLTGLRMHPADLADVVRAAFGENVSPQAQALYRAWLKPTEALRARFNAAGGNIGWKDGWGLPQMHNRAAVIRAGAGRWMKFIDERLDWDKMRHPDGEVITAAERPGVLKDAWDTIATDGWNKREPSARQQGSLMLANTRQDARFFVLKDATAWTEYNTQFGSGDTMATMMGHTHAMARDVAMMERLGPNPAATTEWLKQVVQSEAAKWQTGEPSLWRAPSPLDVPEEKLVGPRIALDKRVARAQRTLDGFYDEMRPTDSSGWLSLAGTILRNFEYSAKLGSAVILHAVTNPIIQGFARYASGLPVMKMMTTALDMLGSASRQELLRSGLIMEDAMHAMGQGAREAGLLSRAAGISRILPDFTVRMQGLKVLVDVMKRTFQADFMGHIADNIGATWQELAPRLRDTMRGYGLTAQDWRVMQMAELYEPVTGARWLRFQDITDVGVSERAEELAKVLGFTDPEMSAADRTVAIAKATNQTAMKYLEMIQQETERAVPSGTWRSRAMIIGKSDPNTMTGQVLRSFSMFKGFISSMMVTQLGTMARELGASKARGAGYAGGFLFAMTMGGMLALQLKQMRSGKDLRNMDPTTGEGMATWAHAMLTGGGLGVFGDFLASDQNSYGHGFFENLAGPVASLASDAWGMKDIFSKKGDFNLTRTLTNFARYNTPFLSTAWPLQTAYYRVVLDQLQMLGDPKAHQRMRQQERRLFREYGQEFFWRPGDPLPARAPQYTGAAP
jgi:hypothetical protein